MNSNCDYKDTLNMPKTDFPMKGELTKKDSHYLSFWRENKIWEKRLKQNENLPIFTLHDGPPYANGSLHTGHALNKILKDFIVRYKNLNGYYADFVAGWDTHGLPIENKILSILNKKHDQISIIELREKAKKFALEQVNLQKQQFQKLALFSPMDHIYITLNKEYEACQLEIFKKMALNNLIYRGLKPVYWSPSSQSALAEAEVEYLEHRSPSIFVLFPLKEDFKNIAKQNDYLLIWTTTPWTLIANSAVAVNENEEYCLINLENKNIILALKLVDQLLNKLNLNSDKIKIIKTFKGKELLGAKYISPINKNVFEVVSGHHVTTENGSGLVHIAPLFGEDDFLIGKKNNLKMIMHINDDGTINDLAPIQYQGIFYEDANKIVGEELDQNNLVLKLEFIKHSYPHDWRTKKPIIYRGTPQWFVSIKKVKDKILNELDKVNFYSSWGLKRLSLMIKNREDWTISRQRAWGVPIIIFYDQNKNPIINEEIFNHVINLIKEHGSDIWYKKTVDELLPKKYQNQNFSKENDIMDVWFDSGSSFYAANVHNKDHQFDLYLEGSDQYRGWFNSSLINSVIFYGKAPYKNVISHGFVLDEKGRKMSKSLGNGIDPIDIVNENGCDILRLWVANSEYTNDVLIGKNILNQVVEIYRKIRNGIRFLLANLNDYQFNDVPLNGVHELINEKLKECKIKIKSFYDQYQFLNIIKEIVNFISDLSTFYFSITKDILYVEEKNNIQRQMVLKNFYLILEFLLLSLAPIIPTTIEEAYSYFNKQDKKESVFLENFYKDVDDLNEEIIKKWNDFFVLKNQIYQKIENEIKKGVFKRTNDAEIIINTKNPFFIDENELTKLLMVAKIRFNYSNQKQELEIIVNKFDGEKCLRCWNIVLKEEMNNSLCNRCFKIINKN